MSIEETGESQSAEDVFLSLLQEDSPATEAPKGPAEELEVEDPGDEQGEELEASDEELDEEGAEIDDEATSDEELFAVKVDGRDAEVTLSELIGGYQRQSDYTKKTQNAAEERKTFEAEKKQFAEDRQVVEQHLRQQLDQIGSQLEQEPNWAEEFELDPIGTPQKKYEWELKIAGAKAASDTQQKQMMMDRHQYLQHQNQLLAQMIPEMVDAEKGPAKKQQITNFLVNEIGLDQKDVADIGDAKVVFLADLAMKQFNIEKQAKKVVSKKVANKPRVAKPGSTRIAKGRKSDFAKKLESYEGDMTTDRLTDVFAELIKS
jgi:hypothetical protein